LHAIPSNLHNAFFMTFDQGEFNFDAPSSDAGWRRWREELDSKKREFESRWGIILGKRVVVSLRNHAKPLCGLIEWIEPPATHRHLPPQFRMRGLEFGPDEIESLAQDD